MSVALSLDREVDKKAQQVCAHVSMHAYRWSLYKQIYTAYIYILFYFIVYMSYMYIFLTIVVVVRRF